jgi:hypothetical protein
MLSSVSQPVAVTTVALSERAQTWRTKLTQAQ